MRKYVVSYLRNESLNLLSQETTKLWQGKQGELTTVTHFLLVRGVKKVEASHCLPTRTLRQDVECARNEVVKRGGCIPAVCYVSDTKVVFIVGV